MAGVKPAVFSLFIVVLIVVGTLDVILNFEENKCEMTWMFEQPQYVKVPMPKAVSKRFPNYGLYIYGEGKYAEIVATMKLTGVPVLFIPGNAGSHKQARSVGSVAFRRIIDKDKRYHFNVFTVDLNEELSGLYGGFLKDQTEFVHEAIKRIFKLYKESEVKPTTIVLIGHSMGGMVARALFTLPDFDPKTVNTIFMQATPNQEPVVVLDRDIAEFYEKVNGYWMEHSNSTLQHVTLVSSGGGEYDIQVRGGLTPLDGIVDESRHVSTSTTHTPKAWVSTDHRCIVWCKQVVFGFVRSMCDIMEERDRKIKDDAEYRMAAFRHHFLKHAGTAAWVPKWSKDVKLDPSVKWTVLTDRVFKWEKDSVDAVTYLAIPVRDYEDVDHAVIVSNIVKDSWICTCELKDGEQTCSTCTDLSSTGNVLPPLYSNKKVVNIDLNSEEMARITHILLLVPATDKMEKPRVEVTGEVYGQDKRHLSNSLPGLLEVIMSLPESISKGTMVLDLGRAAFYKLKLYNMNHVVKVFHVRLEAYKCTGKFNKDSHTGSVLRFHMPWGNEDVYKYIEYGKNGNMSLKAQYIPPTPAIASFDPDVEFELPHIITDYVELFIHLDPTCYYKLRISMSFKEILGQFVRFYGILMPAFCVAVLLMAMVHQLRAIAKDGVCPSVLDSLWQIKPFYVVPFALLTQFILQMKVVQKLTEGLIPAPDIATLDRQGISFRGAQPVLYLIAMAVTTFQAGVIYLILQFKSRVFGLTLGWLPAVFSRLGDGVAVMLCVASVGFSATVCGSIGVFVCYVIGFLQVLRLCYRCQQSKDPGTRSRCNFFQTVFMLWMWLLILNSPPLVVLGKSVQLNNSIPVLGRDPSRITGTVAAISFLCLLFCNTPLSDRTSLRGISFVIHLLVTQMLVFGMVSLYRITYVIVASLALVAATQILGTVTSKNQPRQKTE